RPALRAFGWPALGGAGALMALFVGGVRPVVLDLALALAAAVATTVVLEIGRVLTKRPAALLAHRRRYGAYLAHLGLAVVVAGVAASHFGQQEEDVTLAPGQSVTVAGHTLTYTGAEERDEADHTDFVATMRFGDQTLEPARATYAGLGGQSLTHVAISTTPLADVYVVLAATDADGSASFRVIVNPLVTWIWAGGIVVI